MLQNACLVAKIGADTAENEQHFAEILPTDALWRLSRALLDGRAGEGPQGGRPHVPVSVAEPEEWIEKMNWILVMNKLFGPGFGNFCEFSQGLATNR